MCFLIITPKQIIKEKIVIRKRKKPKLIDIMNYPTRKQETCKIKKI